MEQDCAGLPLLTRDNYRLWKLRITAILEDRQLEEVVFVTRLGTKAKTDDEKAHHEAKLRKAKMILTCSVDADHTDIVSSCKTAQEIWSRLETEYANKEPVDLDSLLEQYHECRLESGKSVSDYISKVESYVRKLANLHHEIADKSMMARIVSGLTEDYSDFKRSWNMTPVQFRSKELLVTNLKLEEENLKKVVSHAQAMYSKSGYKNNNRKFNKSKKKDFKDDKKKGVCHWCKKEGHWWLQCPDRPEGQKPKLNEKQKDTSKHSEEQSIARNMMATNHCGESDVWFADSGSSEHLTSRLDWFDDLKTLAVRKPIRFGNNEFLYAQGIGTIKAVSLINGKAIPIVMRQVYYVPGISNNLYSLGKADTAGIRWSNKNGKLELHDDKGLLAIGEKVDSIYRLSLQVPIRANIAKSCRTIDEWHQVFGHSNKSSIKQMVKDKSVEGMQIVEASAPEACGICPEGKGHASSHPSSTRERASGPLQRVHMDLVGKLPPSHQSSEYFLLIKDEYSSYMCVDFLSSKKHVFFKIKRFVDYMATQIEAKVQVIRSDNGTEFKNTAMSNFCLLEGIVQEFSSPYCPQQNGEAERANRTIIETARSMRCQANLDISFWEEAVRAAVYVRNRLPNSRTKGSTPYELFYGRKPSVSHLVRFGQPAHLLQNGPGILKFDAKTSKCLIVGYGDRINTYRCWDLSKKQIVISSDVYAATHHEQVDITTNEKQVPQLRVDMSSERAREDGEIPIDQISLSDSINESFKSLEASYPTEDEQACEPIDLPEVSSEQVANKNTSPPTFDDDALIQNSADQQSRHENIYRNFNLSQQPGNHSSYERPRRQNVKSAYMRANLALGNLKEPETFDEAMRSEQNNEWIASMKVELDAHTKNGTWAVVKKKPHVKEISSRWLYKIKLNPDGSIERFKSRIVARGYSQREGIDYKELFAPVVRMDSIRLLFALAAQLQLKFVQFDIATAFLYGELDEDLYLTPPKGLEVEQGYTCKLHKSLYGLRQAPRCWNSKLTQILEQHGLVRSKCDPCVYFANKSKYKLIICVYVDDGIIFAENSKQIEETISYLKSHLDVKLITSKCFVGVQIEQMNDGSIFLHQQSYINKIIDKFGMSEAVGCDSPVEVNHPLNRPEVLQLDTVDGIPYAELLGSIMYCSTSTRPDLSYAMSVFSRHTKAPKQAHWQGLKRVLRYLKKTNHLGLLYKRVTCPRLICYTDADWAGDQETRKSISGSISYLTNAPVTYFAQQQPVIAQSTTEAEYIAASESVKDLIWLHRFVIELGLKIEKGILMCDNQSAIKLIKNAEFHKRTKHIDIRFHFIRDNYMKDKFEVDYVPTDKQVADVFTKALTKDRFVSLRSMFVDCPP